VKAKDTSTVLERGRSVSPRTRAARTTTSFSGCRRSNAIVTGDSLSDFGEGLDTQLGGRKHVTGDDVARRLRPLLDLPSSSCWLPAHGEPTDRAALERVLS